MTATVPAAATTAAPIGKASSAARDSRASILLATRGKPSADGAAHVAVRLAQRLGTPLAMVAVQEPTPIIDYGFGPIVMPSPESEIAIGDALLADARTQMERCSAPPSAAPVLEHGPAAWCIADAAQRRGVEVIVTGLGAHHIAERALGNETALHLAQIASTPILAVPTAITEMPGRVVAAIDFTPSSLRAATLAASWLVSGAELVLLHVAPELAPTSGADERLARFASTLTLPPGIRLKHVVVTGDPARALLSYADNHDCGLIALGSHGYGFWKRLALGSVASKVIRLSTHAVLVVPLASVAATP